MHHKVIVLIFINICPKRAILENSSLTILLSSFGFVFSSPPQKKFIQILLYYYLSAMGPCLFFYQGTSFASPTTKLVGPCQWIL